MAPLQSLFERLFAGDDALHECRNCGETVDADVDRCPTCNSSEIASYHVE